MQLVSLKTRLISQLANSQPLITNTLIQLVSLKTRLNPQSTKKPTANSQWPTANRQHANAACLVENEAKKPTRQLANRQPPTANRQHANAACLVENEAKKPTRQPPTANNQPPTPPKKNQPSKF
jgi:hypothetical protein